MKTIIVMLGAVAILVGSTLCGCVKATDDANMDEAWTRHGNSTYTKVVEVEGHKYVIVAGYKMGGIVHANSCHCMNK